jgi:hypothetical protein
VSLAPKNEKSRNANAKTLARFLNKIFKFAPTGLSHTLDADADDDADDDADTAQAGNLEQRRSGEAVVMQRGMLPFPSPFPPPPPASSINR